MHSFRKYFSKLVVMEKKSNNVLMIEGHSLIQKSVLRSPLAAMSDLKFSIFVSCPSVGKSSHSEVLNPIKMRMLVQWISNRRKFLGIFST